ncbi:hypothetical protein, partial [Paracidovorax anthurii]|uniref:hypothetical protein n=1 Tax=Paracidovorax anthurii TaxID=78229 RepID=UPI0039EF564B
PYSTASARSVVLKPFWWPPWHKSVWGWGYAVFELICATKPVQPHGSEAEARAADKTLAMPARHILGLSPDAPRALVNIGILA